MPADCWATRRSSAPAFAAKPTFEPTALFLTWQRDPTTTMTVQWIGDEKDAADRPIWFAKQGTEKPGGSSRTRPGRFR